METEDQSDRSGRVNVFFFEGRRSKEASRNLGTIIAISNPFLITTGKKGKGKEEAVIYYYLSRCIGYTTGTNNTPRNEWTSFITVGRYGQKENNNNNMGVPLYR